MKLKARESGSETTRDKDRSPSSEVVVVGGEVMIRSGSVVVGVVEVDFEVVINCRSKAAYRVSGLSRCVKGFKTNICFLFSSRDYQSLSHKKKGGRKRQTVKGEGSSLGKGEAIKLLSITCLPAPSKYLPPQLSTSHPKPKEKGQTS